MAAGTLSPQNKKTIDMFYAKISEHKAQMVTKNRNSNLRVTQTETKDKRQHLKKQKVPSSCLSNRSQKL